MKSQDNFVFGNSGGDQFTCDAIFNAIPLNPNFVVDNLNVNDTAVNALFVVPSSVHQQKVIAIAVNDDILVNLSVAVGNRCMFF